MNHSTPYSTNAVSICKTAGISQVTRFELSRRYYISGLRKGVPEEAKKQLVSLLHDRLERNAIQHEPCHAAHCLLWLHDQTYAMSITRSKDYCRSKFSEPPLLDHETPPPNLDPTHSSKIHRNNIFKVCIYMRLSLRSHSPKSIHDEQRIEVQCVLVTGLSVG